MSDHSQKSNPPMHNPPAPQQNGKRSLVPGKVQFIIVGVCVVLITLARLSASSTTDGILNIGGDIANILTLIFSFVAFVTLLLWFCRRSGYPQGLRRATPPVLVGIVILIAIFYRIDSTSGDLIPTFKPRWAKRHDELLEKAPLQATEQLVDLKTTTADDFPQFLGPHGHPYLPEGRIGATWPPKQLWKRPIGAGWSAFSVVNGFAVTMEQRGPDELVTCYDARSGELKWSNGIVARHENTLGGIGPRSTPTIHEGKVYSLGATGMLRCLDGGKGDEVWRCDLFELIGTNQKKDESVVQWGRSSSPLIVDDMVIIPAGGPPGGPFISLIAFDKNTGKEIWRGGNTQISYATSVLATIDGVRQIVSVNESNVTGHDPRTGEVLWTYDWPGSSSSNASSSQPVVVAKDQVLLSKGYGTGAALVQVSRTTENLWKTEMLWHKWSAMRTKFTNVVVRDGYIYGLSDGILECVELKSGRSRWKRGRYEHGQILCVGETLIVISEAGELVLVPASPEPPKELAKFTALEGQTWNNLCLAGRLLLVRNGQEAACFELD